MANTKSAEKRIKLNKRNCLQNKYYKTSVRTLTKLFFKNLEEYSKSKNVNSEKKLKKILSSLYSLMDKGTKKNVFHKNTIARKKSKLAACFKNA